MRVTIAAAYNNLTGETLVRSDDASSGEAIYDLPHLTLERPGCYTPQDHEWAKIGAKDQVGFVRGKLLEGISIPPNLFYEAVPHMLAHIIHAPEGRWRFVDLTSSRADIGKFALGPLAKRMHHRSRGNRPFNVVS